MTRATRATDGNERATAPSRALRAGVAIAIAVVLAALPAAAIEVVDAPSTERVDGVPEPAPLDYTTGDARSLRRVRSDFVTESLGLRLPSGPAATAAAPANGIARVGQLVDAAVLGCVDGRQTADPLSPPCVDRFTGDNGGATYAGVSGEEIRILVKLTRRDDPPPSPSYPRNVSPRFHVGYGADYFDLWQPPAGDEPFDIEGLRIWQEWFNRRYQTYGRRVHLFAYLTDPIASFALHTNEALENWLRVKPFAVVFIDWSPYDEGLYWARRGVPAFLAARLEREYVQRHPGLLYSYGPTQEQYDELLVSYICQKVVGHPVALSGNPGENGRPRRLAIVEDAYIPRFDPDGSSSRRQQRVRAGLARCGAHIEATLRIPYRSGCHDPIAVTFGPPQESAQIVAEGMALRARGITTLLDIGCSNYVFEQAAGLSGWAPEVIGRAIVGGSINTPGLVVSQHQRAIGVTASVYTPLLPQRRCFAAQREERPDRQPDDAARRACALYDPLRQVFSALQLAGPTLTPETMLAGVRSLEFPATGDPEVPGCWYPEGDYSCIKDGIAVLRDSTGVTDAGNPTVVGCWRAIEGGRRHLPWRWPDGNVDAQIRGDEPCADWR